MPSGFLTLPDGRCLACRWQVHDNVLKAVVQILIRRDSTHALGSWLARQLPGPNDIDELGYGAWLRDSDGETVVRSLDLRRMNPEHQEQFCNAALEASRLGHDDVLVKQGLDTLADMVKRFERGEAPESRTDLQCVVPPEPGTIGPN